MQTIDDFKKALYLMEQQKFGDFSRRHASMLMEILHLLETIIEELEPKPEIKDKT